MSLSFLTVGDQTNMTVAYGPFSDRYSDVGNIPSYRGISRKEEVAARLLFSLNFLCHDMLKLFADMLPASQRSCAADGWSQRQARVPTPGSCIMPCAGAAAFRARFPPAT